MSKGKHRNLLGALIVAMSGLAVAAGCASTPQRDVTNAQQEIAGSIPEDPQFVNQHSNMCLDVSRASTSRGANIIQWQCHGGDNQNWRLVDVGGGYYNIVAQHSGMCLDVARASLSAGTGVIQWQCHRGGNQKWRLVDVGGGYYNIVAQHSNMCLDVARASTSSGANVIQWRCHGGGNQKWRLVH